jgi:hypothetical protein
VTLEIGKYMVYYTPVGGIEQYVGKIEVTSVSSSLSALLSEGVTAVDGSIVYLGDPNTIGSWKLEKDGGTLTFSYNTDGSTWEGHLEISTS